MAVKAEFDFTDVEDNDFTPVPKGEYPAVLFDVNLKETRAGDDMYVLIFKIAGGDQKGKQLFLNLPVMKSTMWKIKQTLVGLGMQVPKSAMSIDFDALMGRKCNVVVDHREYDNKIYADVKEIKPANLPEDEGLVAGSGIGSDVPF